MEMAEYLFPNNDFSIEQKQRIVALRNKMVEIPNYFSSKNEKTLCICGEDEVMSYI